MKKIIRLFSVVVLLFFVATAEAQILRKLTKKIQDKAISKAVEADTDSAERKDEVLGFDKMAMAYGKNRVDAALVPSSYPFSWEYSLEMQTENEKPMIIDYYLEPNVEYFGFKMRTTEDMFLIIDSKNKFMITTFNQKKGKMAMASRMPDYTEIADKGNEIEKFSYKTLPNKVIMGFNCKGIQATSADLEMVFYYTNEAKVSFSDMFKAQQKKSTPNALKNYFKPSDNPLMMTMTMKDLKNKGAVTTMKCISLVKKTSEFKKSDYTFM